MKSRLKLISCAVTVYFGVLLSSILHNLICVLRIDHIVSELKEEKQFFKMGKFVVMFVMEFFVIMPIVFGRYHGRYDSYKQYYDQINSGGPKYPTTTYKMSKESFYDVKENMKPQFEDNSKNKIKGIFEFSDEWQPRNGGDNYASVPRCEKQTFCEDVPNYPQAYVNQELAKNSSLLQYAYQDVIAVSPRLDNEDIPLCLSTERLILPKTAVNMQDQWMYIVQGDDNFRQSLRIEACKEEDAKCEIIDGFAEGYITSCKQKYIYRELSAISADGKIVRDFFRLPASCCCHVEFNAEDERAKIKLFSRSLPSSDHNMV